MIEYWADNRARLAVSCRSASTRLITGFAIMLALAAVLATPAAAQNTQTADAQAFLVTPLSFVKQTDLDFGKIVPGNADGEVNMDSDGIVTTTNGIAVLDGTSQLARFWGYGTLNQTVLINIDQNTYLLTREGGAETLLFDRVTIGSRPPIRITRNPRRFRIVNPDGFFSFTIAGRLQIASDQAPGVYNGEFTVTLEYE